MNCDKCRELLSEYIDGRLGVEDSSAVAAHLETCAACRALDRELRASIALMGDLEVKSPPQGFADSVTARLERRMLLDTPIGPEEPRRTFRPLPLAGVGLAAAAVILVAVYFMRAPAPVTISPTVPLSSQAAPSAPAKPIDALRNALTKEPEEEQHQVGELLYSSDYPGGRKEDKAETPVPVLSEKLSTAKDAEGAALDAKKRAKDSGLLDIGPAVAAAKERERRAKEAAPNALGLGLAHDTTSAPAKPAEAPASVAAEAEVMTRQLKVEGETKAKSLAETTARREAADRLAAPAAPAAATAPTAGQAQFGAAAGAAEQVVAVSSTDSAIAAAYALVAALPSDGSKPLPQGALSADLLRYAAFQRGAAVPEASDDKAVVEATLPSSTVAALRDSLTGGAGSKESFFARTKAEEAVKGGVAGADSAGNVKVRFVFERVTPAAK